MWSTNRASGGDGIPVELFQILKDDAVKVLNSICQQIWKIQQWPQDWKRSVFIPIPKKGNAKECSNYRTITLISHASSKVMLKTLQARLQQYVNRELPDVQAGFKKGRETEIKMPTSAGSSKKQESSRKTSISTLLTMPKPLTVWITTNCGKFLKRCEYSTTWPASWECMYACQEATVRTGHGTTDWFQIGKEYVMAVYCHHAYLTHMQSTLWEMLDWMKHKLWNQDCQEKYQWPQICRWHDTYGRKWRRTKEPFDETETGEWKIWLKLNIQKTKIMASGPISSWQIDGETMERLRDFILGGSKITVDGDCSHEI